MTQTEDWIRQLRDVTGAGPQETLLVAVTRLKRERDEAHNAALEEAAGRLESLADRDERASKRHVGEIAAGFFGAAVALRQAAIGIRALKVKP